MRATALTVFTFTTLLLWGGHCLAQAPELASYSPGQNELNVSVSSDIVIQFNMDMTYHSIDESTFKIRGRSHRVTGTLAPGSEPNQWIFYPDNNFAFGDVITVTLTDGIESSGGVPFAGFSWSFTVTGCGYGGEFELQASYDVGNWPEDIYVANLGLYDSPDLIMPLSDEDSVSLLFNDGNGLFPDPEEKYFAWWGSSQAIVAAQLDGDSDLDLAMASFDCNCVGILLNNLFPYGIPTFQPTAEVHSVGIDPRSIIAADLDNDGDLDLVTASFQVDNDLSVLINNGDATFQTAVPYPAGDSPSSVFSADIDNDGDLDLISANAVSYNITIRFNDGNGIFASSESHPVGANPRSVFAADFDNDGDLDLATANASGSYDISVLVNSDYGTFLQAVHYISGTSADDIFAADLDNDGDIDLATSSADHDQVGVLFNNGDATFLTPGAIYDVGNAPNSIFAADLNNDGLLDLVTANGTSIVDGFISVLFNKPISKSQIALVSPAPEELNVDNEEPITVTFDMGVVGATVTPSSFIVNGSLSGLISEQVGVTVNYDYNTHTATFTNLLGFEYGEVITVTLTDNIILSCGATMAPYTWSFTTKTEDGTGVYNAAIPYDYGAQANCVRAADFDNDGWVDVATSIPGDSLIAIFMNDQNGGFITPPQVTPYVELIESGNAPWYLIAAELNGDTYTDLIAVGEGKWSVSYDHFYVFLNSGNPANLFDDIDYYGAGDSYRYAKEVSAADFNGDGYLDLVVVRPPYQGTYVNMSVYFNDGAGGFPDPVMQFPQFNAHGFDAVCTGDFDGDGSMDIAGAAWYYYAEVPVLYNNGDGTFADPVNIGNWGFHADAIYPADLNADGLLDMVIPYEPPASDAFIQIVLNDPTNPGTFYLDASYVLAQEGFYVGVNDVEAADVDEDGDLDLVVGVGRPWVDVMLNDGNGGFFTDPWHSDPRYQKYYTTSLGSSEISVADYNKDGGMDIATISPTGILLLTNISKLFGMGYGSGTAFNPLIGPISGAYVEIRTPEIPPLGFDGSLPQYKGTSGQGGNMILEVVDSTYTNENGFFEFYVAPDTYDIFLSHESFNDTLITGIIVTLGDSIIIPDIPMSPAGCDYVVGDANGSGGYNGLDITYGVNFFKGGNDPICDTCILCPDWFYCGDVNGSCNYNGLDVTYGVSFLKGIGPDPVACVDCPPIGGIVTVRKEQGSIVPSKKSK